MARNGSSHAPGPDGRQGEKLRVLHVQRVAGIGGSERHLLALLPELADRGIGVSMCVLDAGDSEGFVTGMREAGISTHVVPGGGDLNPALVGRLAKLVRHESTDLVHTHLIHADVHGQLAALLCRVPGVSTMHGTAAPHRREPSRTAAALAGHRARRTIAISQHVARFIRDHRLAPSRNVRVIHYGIDAGQWRVDHASRQCHRTALGVDGEVVVVVASRLIPDKGHAELLDAFAEAVAIAPGLRLLVAGSGPLRRSLIAQAERLGTGGAVRFLGFVEDVPSLLGAADLVAFPSMPAFGEGFGLVNLEAMATGRPVLATAVDSIPEIVVNGETGVLVRPGDRSQLTCALVNLARDSALRAQLGEAGRRRAEELFSIDRMVDGTIEVYEEVLHVEA